MGAAQAFLLRGRIRRPVWWILATALGLAAGSVVPGSVMHGTDSRHAALIGWASFGAVLGVAQYAVLRPTFRRSGWWIPASVVAWAAGWVAGEAAYRIEGLPFQGFAWLLPSFVAGGFVNGAVGATVQAFVLTRKGVH